MLVSAILPIALCMYSFVLNPFSLLLYYCFLSGQGTLDYEQSLSVPQHESVEETQN